MDNKSKFESKTYKTFKRKQYKIVCDLGMGKIFGYDTENTSHKRKKLIIGLLSI